MSETLTTDGVLTVFGFRYLLRNSSEHFFFFAANRRNPGCPRAQSARPQGDAVNDLSQHRMHSNLGLVRSGSRSGDMKPGQVGQSSLANGAPRWNPGHRLPGWKEQKATRGMPTCNQPVISESPFQHHLAVFQSAKGIRDGQKNFAFLLRKNILSASFICSRQGRPTSQNTRSPCGGEPDPEERERQRDPLDKRGCPVCTCFAHNLELTFLLRAPGRMASDRETESLACVQCRARWAFDSPGRRG
jgi:hypothetical protein